MTNISANYNYLPARQDPDTYAKTFATQNGITVDEAKEQLKAKYGDPKPQNDESVFTNNNSSNSNFPFDLSEFEESEGEEDGDFSISHLIKGILGLFKGAKATNSKELPERKDPDEYAQTYADEHNITLEEAKAKLQELYGAPQDRA